ncbi:MAG: c-type cytochrome [Stenotrophobium sp.]
MMKFARAGALLFAALLTLPAFAEGNAEAGRIKSNTCMGCHGIPEYNSVYPTYRVPKLGGQHADYLVSALKEYRSRERGYMTMQAQASNLSDQDIEDIAAYLEHAPATSH